MNGLPEAQMAEILKLLRELNLNMAAVRNLLEKPPAITVNTESTAALHNRKLFRDASGKAVTFIVAGASVTYVVAKGDTLRKLLPNLLSAAGIAVQPDIAVRWEFRDADGLLLSSDVLAVDTSLVQPIYVNLRPGVGA